MSKIDYKNLSSLADFKAAANSLVKRNLSTKKDMQSALMCAIKHMDAHGDYDRMKALIEVGPSFGKNLNVALQEWVLRFTWLALDGKAWAKDKDKHMDVAGAEAKDWWLMEPESKAKPFDFQKALEGLFTAIGKELEKPDSALDRTTIFNGIEANLSKIVPMDDQIAALFKRLDSDHDRNAVLGLLAAEMVPAVQSQPETPELESEAA